MAISFQTFKESNSSREPHLLIVGFPLGHTLSPLMHNTALHHYGMEARYLAVELKPDEISSFISHCNSDFFIGCNITLPYKEEFFRLADRMDPDAEEIGALNVLVMEDHQLVGYNTDIDGFLAPLREYGDQIDGSRAIVFGTGGSSKAVCTGLRKMGVEEIVQVSRSTPGSFEENGTEDKRIVDYSQWAAFAVEATIIVNCTPLGMKPDIGNTPVRESEAELLEAKLCYDLVYNPVKTTFLSQAEKAGGIAIGGLEMLIEQGSRAFELWTGKPFPGEIVRDTIKKHFLSGE